ncbi:hypothetical protein SARC_13358, partial [Sphaeroforma arctica JP610]
MGPEARHSAHVVHSQFKSAAARNKTRTCNTHSYNHHTHEYKKLVIKLVQSIMAGVRNKTSTCHQMIMGAGKTTIISPLLCLMLADGKHLVTQASAGQAYGNASQVSIVRNAQEAACDVDAVAYIVEMVINLRGELFRPLPDVYFAMQEMDSHTNALKLSYATAGSKSEKTLAAYKNATC